jgi:hypothetical protein
MGFDWSTAWYSPIFTGGILRTLLFKFRFAKQLCGYNVKWREAWYIAGSYVDEYGIEDDPIEAADTEASYMFSDQG